VQELVVAAGGVAAVVRSLDEWRRHPQGAAVAQESLVDRRVLGAAPPRPRAADAPPTRPAAGVRVLDLTRVIAGPVATRYLGALGADVLRVEAPARPDGRLGRPADGLIAKRSTVIDLGTPAGLALLHTLLDDAHVLVTGYRPGALDRFGLGADAIAERHPGLVAVHLDAWGHTGPWAGRRGFDSIVQAASGIAVAESPDGDGPGVLPCQLLDHGTGYLVAAAVLEGLRYQGELGGTPVRALSLARTAHWLTSVAGPEPGDEAPPPRGADSAGPDAWTVDLPSAAGPVRAVRPPGELAGEPLAWPSGPTGAGTDPPAWSGS
jgi:hypothetical protein